MEHIFKRYGKTGVRLYFRADAAFAKPEMYEYLEPRVIGYAIRLPANDILEQEIKHLVKRPEGELLEKPVILYHDFQYQVKSWDHRQGRSALLQRAGDSGVMD